MNILELTATANRLAVDEDVYSTGGSVNFDKCEFSFSSDWDGFEKTAVFGIGRDTYKVALDSNNSCLIPPPCMEKEGLITIGVYGQNDNVVIATNSVAHHVNEGVDGLGEWFEEDYSLVLNAVKHMKEKITNCILDTNRNFEALSRIIRREGNVTESAEICDSPDDWYIPVSDSEDAEDLEDIVDSEDIEEYYNYGFNPLCAAYPNYVKKETVGYDAGGDNPVYAYIFEPLNYEKTVLVTSGVHGYEASAVFALSKLFKDICENSGENRTLSYFRNKIKFVVIPIVNPYGMINGTTCNENDVDIGYNFPYCWSSCTKTKKGSEAGDQTETVNIMEYAELLQLDKLCAAVDVHRSIYTVSGKSLFYPRFNTTCLPALTDFVNRFNYEIDTGDKAKGILAPSINPTLSNYLADEYGINTCEAVWPDELYGGDYSDDNYVKFAEFLGNLLCVMAKNSSFACKCADVPFTKYLSWRGNDDSFAIPNSASPTVMGITNYALSLSSPCILNVQGYVVINVSESCTVKINPLLYQLNSPEQTYNDRKEMTSPFAMELELSTGTHVIPISSVLQAYYTSYNASSRVAYCETVKFRIAFSASVASAAEVTAFTVTVSGIPSDTAKPVEISTPMGEVADYGTLDVPTQQIIYPLGTYTSADSKFND